MLYRHFVARTALRSFLASSCPKCKALGVTMKKLLLLLLLSVIISPFARSDIPTEEDVIGLSEKELYKIHPEVNIPSSSFLNLVSKNLHPYHAPRDHVFLRCGKKYLVFELKNGKVIAMHKVSG